MVAQGGTQPEPKGQAGGKGLPIVPTAPGEEDQGGHQAQKQRAAASRLLAQPSRRKKYQRPQHGENQRPQPVLIVQLGQEGGAIFNRPARVSQEPAEE